MHQDPQVPIEECLSIAAAVSRAARARRLSFHAFSCSCESSLDKKRVAAEVVLPLALASNATFLAPILSFNRPSLHFRSSEAKLLKNITSFITVSVPNLEVTIGASAGATRETDDFLLRIVDDVPSAATLILPIRPFFDPFSCPPMNFLELPFLLMNSAPPSILSISSTLDSSLLGDLLFSSSAITEYSKYLGRSFSALPPLPTLSSVQHTDYPSCNFFFSLPGLLPTTLSRIKVLFNAPSTKHQAPSTCKATSGAAQLESARSTHPGLRLSLNASTTAYVPCAISHAPAFWHDITPLLAFSRDTGHNASIRTRRIYSTQYRKEDEIGFKPAKYAIPS
ncbi:uncharacterized protein CLUP02_01159 [Colletotrichum lupini]|uniref:Uncharacterized protein n=1 Tax=Colletotrichum lupini TaxID=145971 RepID=A0A9Q8SCF9_9PEZI|nr:uncharacterized protein CLUP02_01159 [Colletotrichum lupini]UQC74508.1 hypothetical protein CLUP02_01159 [Colletotrichum lupini]